MTSTTMTPSDRIVEIAEGQGWTDETLLGVLFEIMDRDPAIASKVIEAVAEVARNEPWEDIPPFPPTAPVEAIR